MSNLITKAIRDIPSLTGLKLSRWGQIHLVRFPDAAILDACQASDECRNTETAFKVFCDICTSYCIKNNIDINVSRSEELAVKYKQPDNPVMIISSFFGNSSKGDIKNMFKPNNNKALYRDKIREWANEKIGNVFSSEPVKRSLNRKRDTKYKEYIEQQKCRSLKTEKELPADVHHPYRTITKDFISQAAQAPAVHNRSYLSGSRSKNLSLKGSSIMGDYAKRVINNN